MVGCLINLMVGYFVGWLVAWLIVCLAGCLVGWELNHSGSYLVSSLDSWLLRVYFINLTQH